VSAVRLAVAAFAVTLVTACDRYDPSNDVVGRYCNYGSTSKAQYDGCVEHVTADDIARRYDRIKGPGPEADNSAAVYAEECDGSSGAYSGQDNMPECELAP
jgi:hypothetical protein